MTGFQGFPGRRQRNQQKLRRIAAAVGRPFSPDDIASLSAWYDAEDDSTITEGLPGFCRTIANKGSIAKDFENLNNGQQPAIVQVSGHQMLFFDGTDDFLADVQTNDVLRPGSDPFTIVALVTVNAAISSNAIGWNQRDGMPGGALWVVAPDTLATWLINDGTNSATIDAADETWNDTTTRWIFVCDRDASNIHLYYGTGPTLNESAQSPVSSALVGNLDQVNSVQGNLSPTPAVGRYYHGHWGEWFFFKSALSEAERNAMAIYLSTKWELTGP